MQLISERLDPNYDGVITKEELKLLKQSCLIGGSGRGARPNSKGRGDSRGNSRPQSSPRESRSRGARPKSSPRNRPPTVTIVDEAPRALSLTLSLTLTRALTLSLSLTLTLSPTRSW